MNNQERNTFRKKYYQASSQLMLMGIDSKAFLK